jgi:hypothetical protein
MDKMEFFSTSNIHNIKLNNEMQINSGQHIR